MRFFSHRHRPVHLGPYPMERLARAALAPGGPAPPGPASDTDLPGAGAALPRGMPGYLKLFQSVRDGAVAAQCAPITDDLASRAHNVKAGVYFLDSDLCGICEMPEDAWTAREHPDHRYAVVILNAFTTPPEAGTIEAQWIAGTQGARADLRAAEVAVVTAGYIRNLGFAATAHFAGASAVNLNALALRAGVALAKADSLTNPFLGGAFRIAAVTTGYPMQCDAPLAADASRCGLAWWLGLGGTRPGWKRLAGQSRPLHMGRYPMEKIKRVPVPTTLIIPEEIKRVSKRASFFARALQGDLGERTRRERTRFALKHPYTMAMAPLIRGMVPMQDGPVASNKAPGLDDPRANARAVKALGYYLGADMIGICKAESYCWHSHRDDGTPIEPYHGYAVVMLIDQGFETMEGASGDDWISGAQSMRGYMRGALIAGVMAEHLRSLGFPSRAQTNADSDVLQIPVTLLAGLGELPRIGELVLNPFVGPRLKTVVLTTDLPMEVDRPIDFGLRDFCSKCLKCARECPCDAISFDEPVMYNGYEIWKPDVERCARYRLTNPKGSACGRCMKMCPFNTEGLLLHRAFLWAAIQLPWTRRLIAKLDDIAGNGQRNPVKKWWFDLEWVDGKALLPRAGTNQRDLDPGRKLDAAKHRIAIYPPEMAPPPVTDKPFPPDRKAALAYAQTLEQPAEARRRLKS